MDTYATQHETFVVLLARLLEQPVATDTTVVVEDHQPMSTAA